MIIEHFPYDLNELRLIRVSLDSVTINGADAKFLASLQVMIESQIEEQTKPPSKKRSSKK